MLRSAVFLVALSVIDAKTWESGINARFANLTNEQIKTMLGVLPGKRPFVPRGTPIVMNGAVPTAFDARTNWPKCSVISQIRDQSACGSCWAFSATESFSDRLCVATNGATNIPLSTEDVLSCCDSCGYGC